MAVLVFKSSSKIGPPSIHDLYIAKDVHYSLRDSSKFVQPKFNTTTFGINSLRYSGATLWNKDIPKNFKEVSSNDLNVFKQLVRSWSGPSCKCNVCTLCKLAE